MVTVASLAKIAALVGNPARAGMLMALMGGRALTATELARVAGISPQTASGHLGLLSTGALLCVEQEGRSRYHRLASQEVALTLEALMHLASSRPRHCRRRGIMRARAADAVLRSQRRRI
jgi:DNA-binding transcriptional ArsR family regulator